jgi:hypothetical protein
MTIPTTPAPAKPAKPTKPAKPAALIKKEQDLQTFIIHFLLGGVRSAV